MAWLVVYVAGIVGANWLLAAYGLVAVGPWLVPAGTFAAAVPFVARDGLHERWGWRWSVAAIVAGSALSWLVAPSFAFAAGAAFLLAELLDLGVYAPLRRRGLIAAALASSVVGSAVDSVLFLWLSPLPLSWAAAEGLLVVKWASVVVAVAVLGWWHRRGDLAIRRGSARARWA
jgi:uncharacterized PurR-regulated membrane protein YhhQ (DUF165 family)